MSKRWQYKTVEDILWGEKQEIMFNRLGRRGWELVALDFLRDKAVFKREIRKG